MDMYSIIMCKRNGGSLSREQIKFFIDGYVDGSIPDYQASALLMAIYFRGLTSDETACLTECMTYSGDTVDLSRFGNLTVDKHSTGGVGDKTTLIVAPIAAALGCKVAKMSGRGLGHTGGTVDKLESICGYRTDLSLDEFLCAVDSVGLAVVGQSGNLTPADKLIYALRDVTATVDSVPLIASSIMSKKLAAGAHSIVLDVKVGSGAFMKSESDARELAKCMVEIGRNAGRNVSALITDMSYPLGLAVGNSLEVREAVDILAGRQTGRLYELSVAIAGTMVGLALGITAREAERRVLSAIADGSALNKMKQWISAQGGDVSVIDNPDSLPLSRECVDVVSTREGYISSIDAQQVGLIASMLGAGRRVKGDSVDLGAGIKLHTTVGDWVEVGDRLCTLYTSKADVLPSAVRQFIDCVGISHCAPTVSPIIIATV